MDWTQVLTIVGTNLAIAGAFIGCALMSYFHLDAKLDENRRETHDILRSIQQEMKDFHGRLEKQDAEFKGSLAKQDAEFKGSLAKQDAEFKAHMMYHHDRGK